MSLFRPVFYIRKQYQNTKFVPEEMAVVYCIQSTHLLVSLLSSLLALKPPCHLSLISFQYCIRSGLCFGLVYLTVAWPVLIELLHPSPTFVSRPPFSFVCPLMPACLHISLPQDCITLLFISEASLLVLVLRYPVLKFSVLCLWWLCWQSSLCYISAGTHHPDQAWGGSGFLLMFSCYLHASGLLPL